MVSHGLQRILCLRSSSRPDWAGCRLLRLLVVCIACAPATGSVVAQSTPTINIAWPFPGIVLSPGLQVALYGVVTDPTAGLAPQVGIENASTGLWLQSDGTWGPQQWLPASIVDDAGDWRYLLTPNAGGNFNLTVQLLKGGAVISTAETSFQVNPPPAAAPPPPAPAAISIAWPTSQIIMTSGAQVAIWGTETAPAGATVATSVQNNATGLWLQPDGSFGAQTWFPAPVVNSSGTWQWLYAPANAGSYTVVAQVTSGSSISQASSTFSVVGPPGTFPLQVVNGTGGVWPNSAIWLTIIGQSTPGTWCYLTANGTAYPVNSGPAYQSTVAQNGISYAGFSFQLPPSGIITMPANLQGGRVYISLGSPLYLVSAANGSGITTPDVTNSADPNTNVYWDFYEYTYLSGQAPFGGDTSQVDAFGFPINVNVEQSSTGFSSSTGLIASRAAIYSEFLSSSDANVQGLVTPYRILAPRSSAAYQTSSDSAAMQAYINSTWRWYASSPFTLTVAGQTYTGGVQNDGLLHFSYEGTSGYVLSQPSPGDVWQCSGALATGNQVELALGAQFCAAFNRGVALNTSLWANSSAFYQGSTSNQYSAYLHSVSFNGLAYAFPYDDVSGQSSIILLPNTLPPSLVTLTVGW